MKQTNAYVTVDKREGPAMGHYVLALALFIAIPAHAREPIPQEEYCATDAKLSAARQNVANQLQREKAIGAYRLWNERLIGRPFDWSVRFLSLDRFNYVQKKTPRHDFVLTVTQCGDSISISDIIPDTPYNTHLVETLKQGEQVRISGHVGGLAGLDRKVVFVFDAINGVTIER
jgi:hypothetical protein